MTPSPDVLAAKDIIEVWPEISGYAGWRGFLLGVSFIDDDETDELSPAYSVLIYPPPFNDGEGVKTVLEDGDFCMGLPMNHGQDKGTEWTMEELLELLWIEETFV